MLLLGFGSLAALGQQKTVPLNTILVLIFATATSAYVLTAEVLLFYGLGARLNRIRKGKWIKELEYPYLLLGAAGLYVSINRLEFVEGSNRKLDFWGPFLIASAIAIKLIKVRAETNDWDKL